LGKQVIIADKWFASSKTCSTCGYVKKDLTLDERDWVCPKCQTHHHRDINAAVNLKNYGIKTLLEQQEVPKEETV
jgi:putative transposase